MTDQERIKELLQLIADAKQRGDHSRVKVVERVELEKFDHTVDPPRLIERIVSEDGVKIEHLIVT